MHLLCIVYERKKKGMCQALMAACNLDKFLNDSEYILQEGRGYIAESWKLAVQYYLSSRISMSMLKQHLSVAFTLFFLMESLTLRMLITKYYKISVCWFLQ